MNIKIIFGIIGLIFGFMFWLGMRSLIKSDDMKTNTPWIFLLGSEYKMEGK